MPKTNQFGCYLDLYREKKKNTLNSALYPISTWKETDFSLAKKFKQKTVIVLYIVYFYF